MKPSSLFYSALIFALLFCLYGNSLWGQKTDNLWWYETSLVELREKTISADADSEKTAYNTDFINLLQECLQRKSSLDYAFDSIPYLYKEFSPDKLFRIFSWNFENTTGESQHYTIIQIYLNKQNKMIIHLLLDQKEQIKSPEHKTLRPDQWYGALYYQIIPVKERRKKYYVLLGWNGNNGLQYQKIIDVLTVSSTGKIHFGKDVFKTGKRNKKRIIFNYSASTVMSLKYYPKRKQIVFDHLSPSQPYLKDQYQYYGPDFSFDALELKKGKWTLLEDIEFQGEVNRLYNPKRDKEKIKLYEP